MMQSLANQSEPDFISSLPNDCLIEILSFLSRDELDQMELVNRKLYSISNHNSLQRVKRRIMCSVEQARIAHNLSLKRLQRDDQLNSPLNFIAFEQLDSSQLNVLYVYDFSSNVCTEYKTRDGDQWGELVEQYRDSLEFPIRPVPVHISQLMNHFLQKCHVQGMRFQNVSFDSSFLNMYAELCQTIQVEQMNFSNVEIGSDVTEDDFRKFLKCAITPSVRSFDTCEFNLERFIDEQFINEFANRYDPKNDLSLTILRPSSIGNFEPSRDVVKSIACFSWFEHPLLTLRTEYLADLFQIRLSLDRVGARYEFKISRIPVARDFEAIEKQCRIFELNQTPHNWTVGRIVLLDNINVIRFYVSPLLEMTVRIGKNVD